MKNDLLDEGLTSSHRDYTKIEIVRINDWKIEANERLKHLKQGQYLLFLLSFLALVGIVIGLYFSANPDVQPIEVVIEGIFLALVYLGAALLMFRNPLGGLLLGLGLYVLYNLVIVLFVPEIGIRGFLWKFVIIGVLGRSAFSAHQLKDYLKKLKEIGVPASELDILRKKFKPLPRTPQKPQSVRE